jgi:hypothetical protein
LGEPLCPPAGPHLRRCLLQAAAAAGYEITFTLSPRNSGRRIGIDRDEDGYPDKTERDPGSDPADPLEFPGS